MISARYRIVKVTLSGCKLQRYMVWIRKEGSVLVCDNLSVALVMGRGAIPDREY